MINEMFRMKCKFNFITQFLCSVCYLNDERLKGEPDRYLIIIHIPIEPFLFN